MRPSYHDQLMRKWRAAVKGRRPIEAQYYAERMGGVACVSFTTFVNSWAGQAWAKKLENILDSRAIVM